MQNALVTPIGRKNEYPLQLTLCPMHLLLCRLELRNANRIYRISSLPLQLMHPQFVQSLTWVNASNMPQTQSIAYLIIAIVLQGYIKWKQWNISPKASAPRIEILQAGSSYSVHGLTRFGSCSASASQHMHAKLPQSAFISCAAKIMQLVCARVLSCWNPRNHNSHQGALPPNSMHTTDPVCEPFVFTFANIATSASRSAHD